MDKSEYIIEQYKIGKPLRELERELCMSRKTIKKILKKNNIKITCNRKTGVVEDKILELYNLGWNGKRIADELKISPPTIYDKFRRMGLSLKNRKYPHRPEDDLSKFLAIPHKVLDDSLYTSNKDNNRSTYYVNENFFKNIDTEEKAYMLGLFYADGNVWDRTACLVLRDLELIETAKLLLEYSGPIKKVRKKNGKIYWKLSISRINLIADLINKGCVPKKSLVIKFPTNDIVPNYLLHHFIRGMFDGDGTIYRKRTKNWRGDWKMGIIGTREIVDGFALNCVVNGRYRQSKSKKNTWYYTWSNQQDMKEFIDYIYKDSHFALKRKALRANRCLQYLYEASL